MLSALLCALAAASGYGPSATPRATAPSPGVLVEEVSKMAKLKKGTSRGKHVPDALRAHRPRSQYY